MDALPYGLGLPALPPLLPIVLLVLALKAGQRANAVLIDRYPDTYPDAAIRDVLTKGVLLVLGFVLALAVIWIGQAYFIVQLAGPASWGWNPEAPPPIVIGLAVVVVLAVAGRWAVRGR